MVIPAIPQEARRQLLEDEEEAQRLSGAIAAAVQQQYNHCVPSVQDVSRLLESVDFSRVPCTTDPVCRNSGLQQQLQQAGRLHQQRQQLLEEQFSQLQQQLPLQERRPAGMGQQIVRAHLLQQPPLPAAAYIMAVQPAAAAAAVSIALSAQPAFVACFVPAPQSSVQLRAIMQRHSSAAVLRAGGASGCVWRQACSAVLPGASSNKGEAGACVLSSVCVLSHQ